MQKTAEGKPLNPFFMPVYAVWVPYFFMGTAVAWIFALQSGDGSFADLFAQMGSSLVALMGGQTSVFLDISWLFILAGCMIVVTFGGLIIFGQSLARKPVLEQLQGGAQRRGGLRVKPAMTSVEDSTPIAFDFKPPALDSPLSTLNSARRRAAARFITRHIFRSPLKTTLIAVVAFFFVASLGWLSYTINFTEQEIEYLWDNTIVQAEIIRSPNDERMFTGFMSFMAQAPISREVLDQILVSGYVEDVYLEALWMFGFLRCEADFASFEPPDDLPVWAYTDLVFGVSGLAGFINENTRTPMDDALGILGEDIEVHLAPDFSPDDFVFAGTHLPVPVLVRPDFLVQHGYNIGDNLILSGLNTAVQIIGIYEHGLNRAVNRFGDHRNVIIMPLQALEHHARMFWFANPRAWGLSGLTYMTVDINMNPERNRDLDGIHDFMGLSPVRNTLGAMGEMPLELIIHDQELRNVIEPMEQNLTLLRLFYPIAVGVAAILSVGLSLLLMLQNAKNAAIMRVLGKGKFKSQLTLCGEQMLVCLVGVVLSLTFLLLIGVDVFERTPLVLAGIYFAGAVIGSAIGAFLISAKAPIELLQARQ
jgi:hypothetical protein